MKVIQGDMSPFTKWKANALSQLSQFEGALKTVALPFFFESQQSRQAQRWVSSGSSEGKPWQPLSPAYAKAKPNRMVTDPVSGQKRRISSYPGGGSKLLVATGRLAQANLGTPLINEDYNVLIQNGVLYVRLNVPYAPFVNNKRDIVTFSAETYKKASQLMQAYFDKKMRNSK